MNPLIESDSEAGPRWGLYLLGINTIGDNNCGEDDSWQTNKINDNNCYEDDTPHHIEDDSFHIYIYIYLFL